MQCDCRNSAGCGRYLQRVCGVRRHDSLCSFYSDGGGPMVKSAIWALLCAIFVLSPCAAFAQSPPAYVLGSQPITGFGTLTISNTSVGLSTVTAGPNSTSWPSTPLVVTITNSTKTTGIGIAYLCPFGGTCSAGVGIPLASGATYSVFRPSTNFTVFAVNAATLTVQW